MRARCCEIVMDDAAAAADVDAAGGRGEVVAAEGEGMVVFSESMADGMMVIGLRLEISDIVVICQ